MRTCTTAIDWSHRNQVKLEQTMLTDESLTYRVTILGLVSIECVNFENAVKVFVAISNTYDIEQL